MEGPSGQSGLIPTEDIEELLRRCHRSELLPLAEVLRVNPSGLGLSQLASACARTLRRRGGQDVWNALRRRGEGPPYATLLRDLATRKGLTPKDIEGTEQALLDWWVEESWEQLPEEQQQRVWARLNLEMPPATTGDGALVAFRDNLATGARYGAGMAAVSALRIAPLFPPLIPLAGCLTLLYLGRPRDEVLLPAVLEVSALRQTVRHRVTIGVVGSPSSGKDAAIAALFGLKTGNINPVAGSIREVEISRLPEATALYVVNTPGMGDIIESVTEEARQVLNLIDVYVYVVNAQGGVQARELDDYRRCLASGRPVLAVVNKIDTLREGDRERYLTDARSKLGAPEEDFLAAAFDPLPQLSETPINLDAVQDWIEQHLSALGKDPAELPWMASRAG